MPRIRVGKLQFESLEERAMLVSGGPDLSFHGNGLTTIQFGNGITAEVKAVTVQDGKTVVAGESSDGRIALARFNFDGTPDSTFGARHDGTVLQREGDHPEVRCVRVDSNGRIVVGGEANVGGSFNSAMVVRFTRDGLLDTTFGNSVTSPGAMISDFGQDYSSVSDIAVDPRNGKYLLVGETLSTSIFFLANSDILVARLNSDGTNDGTFGNHGGYGYRPVGLGYSEAGTSIGLDLQGDPARNPFYGSIIVTGSCSNGGSLLAGVLARLTPSGDFDTRFGGLSHGSRVDGDGRMLVDPFFDFCDGLVELDDGSFVVAGNPTAYGGEYGDFTLLHLSSDGTPTRFPGSTSSSSTITTDLPGNSKPHRIMRDLDGELVVMGLANYDWGTTKGTLAMVQYQTTGELDTRFGVNGIIVTGPVDDGQHWQDMAMGPGRRFVVTTGVGFQVARYLDNDANLVSAGNLFTADAYEQGKVAVTALVSRSERLPVPTRVYLQVGGSATSPLSGLPSRQWDFTGIARVPGTVGPTTTCYVDIPANQTYQTVTITPVDDAFPEPTEQVTLRVLANNDSRPDSYTVGSPDVVYVTIHDNDATATLAPTADAYVFNVDPNASVGGTTLYVDPQTWAYLKFDLTGFTSSGVQSVQLRLFGSRLGNGPTTAPVPLSVYKASDTSWQEGQITWNNKPSTSGAQLARTSVALNEAWYSWDITSYVKSELAAGRRTITLVVKNLSTNQANCIFASREDAFWSPQLFVQKK